MTATYTSTGGSSVVVNGTAVVPTTIMQNQRIIGYNNIVINGTATAGNGARPGCNWRWRFGQHRPGSMSDDGKKTALKSATRPCGAAQSRRRLSSSDVCDLDHCPSPERQRPDRTTTPPTGSTGTAGKTPTEVKTVCQNRSAARAMHHQQGMGAGELQHLERLHHRPRPGLRPEGDGGKSTADATLPAD
jgi:hypothetical protein